MRKVKLQVQLSMDGYIAGPTGEMDWMIWNWDDVLKKYVTELTKSADSFFVGRVTYEGMATYWPSAATNPESTPEEIGFANQMNEFSKIVFSSTLSTVNWSNSRLATGTIEEEVAQLKQQPGRDILIYGGARIVSSFIKADLIDEYHLFINPVAIGTGMPIWKEISERVKLKLLKTTVSTCGIVVLCYEPDRT